MTRAATVPGRHYDFRTGRRWRKLVAEVLRQSGRRCHWCGEAATTGDHVVPVARGGAWYDRSNVVAACQPCNRKRSDKGSAAPERGIFKAVCVNIPSVLTISLPRNRWRPITGDYSRRAADDGAA